MRANAEYIRALNFFHNLGIMHTSDFNLNPEKAVALGAEQFRRIVEFIFEKALFVREGIYEDALSYLEMTYKMYEHRRSINQMLRSAGDSEVSFVSEKVGFDYRILGGMVTIFMFDGYTLKGRVNPIGIARISVTFISEGRNLKELQNRWTRDSDRIKEANQIPIITSRIEPFDRIGALTHHNQHIFLPN
jgi:hypothetical protein